MIAVDATVVRPPLSGVHYAVRNQTLALLTQTDATRLRVFATDNEICEAGRKAGAETPALASGLRRVTRRVIWQQRQLPRLLAGCEHLLAMAYTAPQRSPIPYTLQVHDLIALRQPGLCRRLNALHMRALMPGAIAHASRLLTSTRCVAEQLMQTCAVPAQRIVVAPLGIDEIFRQPPGPLPETLAELRPYLLFVGNLEPKKGLPTLLAAYRLFAAKRPDYCLVLAGRVGWKSRQLIRQLDAYDGPGCVRRLGYVDRAELPALYANAAAHVLPSIEEGFGLPVLEALACGTATVHSAHAAISEASGGYGLTFPPGDAEALCAQLLHAIAADEHDLAEARNWARRQTWRRWADTVAGELGALRPTAMGCCA